MSVKGFLGLGLVHESNPARSSASHDAGSHDWLPKKTVGPGLRRGRVRWIQYAQSLLTVAYQPRPGCIRLVRGFVVDLLIRGRKPAESKSRRGSIYSCRSRHRR